MRVCGILAFAAALSMASAGIGQAMVIDCKFPIDAGNLGWLSDRYIFEYDEVGGTARVIDGLIQEAVGKPIPATPKIVSAKQTAFNWTVMSKNTVGSYVKMVMRATYFKGDKTMIVAGKPSGFRESFDQRGTCKVK